MEQKIIIGLAILKKSFGLIISNFWGRFFPVFMDKNKVWIFFKNILVIEKLHKMKVRKPTEIL